MFITKLITGYPSIDKPWLKYYSKEAINAKLPECSIYQYVFDCNKDNLSRVAIDYYGNKISYRDLFNKIDCITACLSALGVKKGEIVTICSINQPEAIYLFLALNRLGAVANMVFGGSSDKELIHSLTNTNTRFVFTLDLFQERFLALRDSLHLEKIVVSTLVESMPVTTRIASRFIKKLKPLSLPDDPQVMPWKSFCNLGKAYDVQGFELVDEGELPAAITYTGGTTGGSKGVVLSNKAMLAVACQYILGESSLSRSHTWAQIMPLFIAYGLACCTLIPMIVGMTVIIRIVLSESIAELYKKKQPNHIIYGPGSWEELADENADLDLSHLTAPISGGDALRPAVEKKINQYLSAHHCKYPILNGYGMTEVGAAVCVNFTHAHSEGSIGIPFVKNVISIFDPENGEELTYGQEGEICIHAPSMMIHYLNEEKETAHVMRMHEDGRYWIHSGDSGYMTEDGFCYITGRLKRYMTRSTHGIFKKIFSLDIESVLLTDPSVTNCAVVPLSESPESSVPVVFIDAEVKPEDREVFTQKLNGRIESELGEPYQPVKYYFLDSFPRTKIGKVDYLALEKKANEELLDSNDE